MCFLPQVFSTHVVCRSRENALPSSAPQIPPNMFDAHHNRQRACSSTSVLMSVPSPVGLLSPPGRFPHGHPQRHPVPQHRQHRGLQHRGRPRRGAARAGELGVTPSTGHLWYYCLPGTKNDKSNPETSKKITFYDVCFFIPRGSSNRKRFHTLPASQRKSRNIPNTRTVSRLFLMPGINRVGWIVIL